MLVQRAVSEDPRWTRAVGDQSSPPSRGKVEVLLLLDARSEGQSGDSLGRESVMVQRREKCALLTEIY